MMECINIIERKSNCNENVYSDEVIKKNSNQNKIMLKQFITYLEKLTSDLKNVLVKFDEREEQNIQVSLDKNNQCHQPQQHVHKQLQQHNSHSRKIYTKSINKNVATTNHKLISNRTSLANVENKIIDTINPSECSSENTDSTCSPTSASYSITDMPYLTPHDSSCSTVHNPSKFDLSVPLLSPQVSIVPLSQKDLDIYSIVLPKKHPKKKRQLSEPSTLVNQKKKSKISADNQSGYSCTFSTCQKSLKANDLCVIKNNANHKQKSCIKSGDSNGNSSNYNTKLKDREVCVSNLYDSNGTLMNYDEIIYCDSMHKRESIMATYDSHALNNFWSVDGNVGTTLNACHNITTQSNYVLPNQSNGDFTLDIPKTHSPKKKLQIRSETMFKNARKLLKLDKNINSISFESDSSNASFETAVEDSECENKI